MPSLRRRKRLQQDEWLRLQADRFALTRRRSMTTGLRASMSGAPLRIHMPARANARRLVAHFSVFALALIGGACLPAAAVDAHAVTGARLCKHPRRQTRTLVIRIRCAAPKVGPLARSTGYPRLLNTVGLGTGRPTAGDPSGVPLPLGDVHEWHQVFAQDFSTSVRTGGFSGCTRGATLVSSVCRGLPRALRARWWAYPDGWPDTGDGATYSPSRVLSIHNGVLDYYIHSVDGRHLAAAVVPKIPGGVDGGGLLYGAYVVRFRADRIVGYKTAWLLWPDGGEWPAEGEIDFPEGDLNGDISAFMHHQEGVAVTRQDVYPTSARYNTWHTAIIAWTPGSCRFILDGIQIGASSRFVPGNPMHWVLQTETATDGTTPTAGASGHLLIAWVAVYRPS